MTADEIRKTAEAMHDQAMDPAKFRGLVFKLAAEAVAQLATVAERLTEIASQQRGVIDTLGELCEEQSVIRALMEAAAHPDLKMVAARQLAGSLAMAEAIQEYNRAHPLQQIAMVAPGVGR